MVAIKYLLDTNILSEPLRPEPNQRVMSKLDKHELEIGISSIALYELYRGMHLLPNSKRKNIIKKYLEEQVALLPVFDFDSASAKCLARVRAELQKKGKMLALVDSQIAAIAAANGLILVTRNVKDFKAFPKLKLQNWFA